MTHPVLSPYSETTWCKRRELCSVLIIFRVLLFCVVPQLPLSHMVPPEIIEYTPYSVAFAMLWIAATLTMTAKFLPSGALHHSLVTLQYGCDSLGRFATAMAIHNNLETLEQTPCSMDIRVPPLTTAISTAMAKLRPSQCTRTHICAAVTRDPHADLSLRVVITELFQTGLPAVPPCSILLRSAPFRSIPCHRLSPIATTVAFDSKSTMMESTGPSLFTVTSVNSNTVKCATMTISTC